MINEMIKSTKKYFEDQHCNFLQLSKANVDIGHFITFCIKLNKKYFKDNLIDTLTPAANCILPK